MQYIVFKVLCVIWLTDGIRFCGLHVEIPALSDHIQKLFLQGVHSVRICWFRESRKQCSKQKFNVAQRHCGYRHVGVEAEEKLSLGVLYLFCIVLCCCYSYVSTGSITGDTKYINLLLGKYIYLSEFWNSYRYRIRNWFETLYSRLWHLMWLGA